MNRYVYEINFAWFTCRGCDIDYSWVWSALLVEAGDGRIEMAGGLFGGGLLSPCRFALGGAGAVRFGISVKRLAFS